MLCYSRSENEIQKSFRHKKLNGGIFSDEKKSDKKVLILFGENKYDWVLQREVPEVAFLIALDEINTNTPINVKIIPTINHSKFINQKEKILELVDLLIKAINNHQEVVLDSFIEYWKSVDLFFDISIIQ